MLSAVILEDELLAAERLSFLLKECDVLVLKKFNLGAKALDWLKDHEVDIVCVDIGLPEMNGIEFVDIMKRHSKNIPYVIFTTAYDEYAVSAFELNAVDYLLKPIKLQRLRDAVERVAQAKGVSGRGDDFLTFNVTNRNMAIQISWQQAAYLHADQKGVYLYTNSGDRYVLQKTLIYWEELLGNKCVRIHRNTLIMRHEFKSLVRMDDLKDHDDNIKWGVKLIDLDVTLPVSRRQLSQIRKELDLVH